MPGVNWEKLFHELDIPIVYAREVLDKYRMMSASQEPGVDLYVQCKRKAMSQALKQLAGSARSSEIVFVSVGDSQVEAEAATDLVWCRDQGIQHRIIKLQDEPTIEDLTNQLQELQEVLPRVCGVEGDRRFELASARSELEALGAA
ncbi:unnamed protein product [Symbiodinium necroappetens]|uniref:Uncharacterized protein n=1 Tax=Symbiodinium necroappetens TaxID=1628268 RepID=A0A812T869_9DINO|nr:unnamed protein product [Symbiodinium necroappetens]